ncbi:hypothetical protein TNCV_1270311 [Trichonephila clavipes]|nr:hypothetical protein TNCV_1270311 [Trichonephila clavipes]
MLDLRSRTKRRQEVEGKAYVAATPAHSRFPGKNRAEYIFLPLWQIYYDTNINLMLFDRRSSFTSCRKSFNSLRSFDSLLSSELALEYFDTALTCTGVTSKIRSATSEAF